MTYNGIQASKRRVEDLCAYYQERDDSRSRCWACHVHVLLCGMHPPYLQNYLLTSVLLTTLIKVILEAVPWATTMGYLVYVAVTAARKREGAKHAHPHGLLLHGPSRALPRWR